MYLVQIISILFLLYYANFCNNFDLVVEFNPVPDVALDVRGDNAKILVKNFGGKNFAQAQKITNFVFISTKIEKFSLYD